MDNEIVISWSVDDGYVGNGEHETSIHPEDFSPEDSKDEIINCIAEAIEDDFKQNVSPSYKNSDVEEAAEKIMQYLKDKYADEDEV